MYNFVWSSHFIGLFEADNSFDIEVRIGFRLGLGSGFWVDMVTGKDLELGNLLHV